MFLSHVIQILRSFLPLLLLLSLLLHQDNELGQNAKKAEEDAEVGCNQQPIARHRSLEAAIQGTSRVAQEIVVAKEAHHEDVAEAVQEVKMGFDQRHCRDQERNCNEKGMH